MWTAVSVIVAVVVVATVGVVVVRGKARTTSAKPRAMKTMAQRYVSDPAYRAQVSHALTTHSSAIGQAEAAPPPTDRELPRVVQGLLSPDRTSQIAARMRLERAGPRARAALLGAFETAACRWVPDAPGEGSGVAGSRLVDMLIRLQCREVGDRVAHLTEHRDWRVFRPAIEARALRGRAADAPWMIELLNNTTIENAHMRHESIRKGVNAAIEQRWIEPVLMGELLTWARANTLASSGPASAWAVALYAKHGGPGALAELRSPQMLSLNNNRHIHFIIGELTAAEVRLPAEFLRGCIRKSLATEDWPWPYVFEPALEGVALHSVEEAVGIASREMDREDGPYARAAMKFIERSSGLPRPWHDPPADMPLTAAERTIVGHLAAVSEAVGEIGNGGLSQYFFNSSGDDWPRHVEAFGAVGFPEGAETLRRAAHLLDRRGASADREVRSRQYAALSQKREAELDKLSGIYWGDGMDRIMLRYMLRHGELFRRIRSARAAAGLETD